MHLVCPTGTPAAGRQIPAELPAKLAKGRQLLLTGSPDNHALGVFSSVKANPAADRELSAGRIVLDLYSSTGGPLLTTSNIACRKLQPQAARKKAGLIMLQIGALEQVLQACRKRGLSRAQEACCAVSST